MVIVYVVLLDWMGVELLMYLLNVLMVVVRVLLLWRKVGFGNVGLVRLVFGEMLGCFEIVVSVLIREKGCVCMIWLRVSVIIWKVDVKD